MGTTPTTLSCWFDDGIKQNATHMIVVCDTFDYVDFPVYVMPGEDARKRAQKEGNGEMQRVTEVYDLRKDKAAQFAEERAFNY